MGMSSAKRTIPILTQWELAKQPYMGFRNFSLCKVVGLFGGTVELFVAFFLAIKP